MSSASQPVNKGLGRVSEREQLLLSLIVTYGFIVKSTWMRLSNGNKDSEDAMASAMWTLTRKRMVIARTLHHGISYFMLSEATATKLGLPKFRSQPMSEASKLRMYARLLYFTRYDSTATSIEPNELNQRLGVPSYGLPQGFYGRSSDPEFLGFLRVDTNIRTSPVRSAQVLRHDVLRLVKFIAIQERLKMKKFDFTLITATQSRADAVLSLFQTYDRIGKAPIKIIGDWQYCLRPLFGLEAVHIELSFKPYG